MVAKNGASFRITNHKHKLNFMRGTKVFKVHADEIPTNHFEFMAFQDILSCDKEDQFLGMHVYFKFSICIPACIAGLSGKLFFTDVIGHVVERNDVRETEKNGKVRSWMPLLKI
jgi:hypothetical protein